MSLANATRSELTKQFTTAMWWILAIVLAGYIAVTAGGLALAFGAAAKGLTGASATQSIPVDGMSSLIYSLASSVGYVFPLLIGTLLATGEFRHKTLTPTFLATPRRGLVLSAKLLAGVAMGVLYAAVAIVATVGPGAGVLAGFGIDTGLGTGDTWAMLGRIVLAFALWVLIGIGVGTLVRNQVAAIVIVLAFTQFVEPLLRFGSAFVSQLSGVARFLPGSASDQLVGASLFTMTAPAGADAAEPLAWWGGGLVLLAYAVVLLVVGYLASWRRDVS